MNTLIPILTTFGVISAVIGIIFFLIAVANKMLYATSNVQAKNSEKISKNFYISAILITTSIFCFLGGKKIIKFDFHDTLQHNKIISVEIDGIFFSQDDIKDVFNNFDSTEGRYRCNHFFGFINLENNETIPIEVIRHCYEKNRYIIISKKYNIDTDIGDIITSKFAYIGEKTVNSQ